MPDRHQGHSKTSQHGDAKLVVLAAVGIAVLAIVGTVLLLRSRSAQPDAPAGQGAIQGSGQPALGANGSQPATQTGEEGRGAVADILRQRPPSLVDTASDSPVAEPTLAGTPPPDADSDGLSDAAELRVGTDPNNDDTDGDGRYDGDEVTDGTDPLFKDDAPQKTVPEAQESTPPSDGQ